MKVRNLTLDTEYEWRVKVWYCSGGNGGWVDGVNFAAECPNVANLLLLIGMLVTVLMNSRELR